MIAIELESIRNIRDLGGTQADGGRTIRPGCLIRAAHLGDATNADLEALRTGHRVCTVIDLRTEEELSQWPDRAEGFEYIPCTLIDRLAGVTRERGQVKQLPDMADLYRQMMLSPTGIAGFRRALGILFDHDYAKGAVLWHCTEGKDLCGMTAALALEALGASRDDILRDYLETNRYSLARAQGFYEKVAPVYGEVYARSVYRSFIADARYIEAAWDAMGKDYLRGALGFDDAAIERFRDKVLA